MKDKSILKTVIKMSAPAMAESFFTSFTNFVDSYMVSSLGASAVAAVALTNQPKFFSLSAFIAMNISASALVARRNGEKNKDGANGILVTGLAMIFVLVGFISTLMVVFASPIIKFCGSTVETHSDAVTYFRIIVGCMVFQCIQMFINAAQRGAGNTKITMRTNFVSNSVNIVFNFLLINGRFGFPALGIRGAAIATVLGTVAAAVMSVLSIMKHECFVSIPYIIANKIKPGRASLKSIIKVGYSIFFEQMLMRAGMMSTALMAANQGMAAMAAHQVGMNLLNLTFSFGDGLQAAAVALIGRSMGEDNIPLARKYGSKCQFVGGVISIFIAITYFLSSRSIMSMMFKETEIINIGVSLIYIIIPVVLVQVRQTVYMGCLRGAGDTAYTAMVSMISVTFVRTAISYICCYPLKMGIQGVWMGILADQVIRFACGGVRFKKEKWINIKI